MGRATAKTAGPTREELTALVEEVNAVLGLENPITVTKKMVEADIIAAIEENAGGQIYESDFVVREEEGEEEGVTFFSEAAENTLKAMGFVVTPGEPPEQGEETPAPAAKGKGKAAAPAKEKAAAPAKEKAAPKAKVAAAPRYTRANAFADACDALKADKKAVTLDALTAQCNDEYVKSGGKENLKEAKWFSGLIVPALVALGYAEVKDGNFQLK